MNRELSDDDRVVRIILEGDPTNSGTATEAIFEFSGGDDQTPLSITHEKRTETRSFSGNLLTLYSDITGDQIGSGAENKDIALDFGSSTFAFMLSGVVTADQRLPDGTQCQWGDTGDDTQLSKTDATGAHPAYKASVLSFWLRNTRQSSVSGVLGEEGGGPAIVETLQYRPNGIYDPLEVVFESPNITYSSGSSTVADLEITAVEVADLGNPVDALANDTR